MSCIASTAILLVLVQSGIAQTSNATCDDINSVSVTCPPPWLYCSDSYATCIDGYCRCANTSQKDFCTCLAISGDCHIERDSASAVGTPKFEEQAQTTYSCVADENCNYDVHVVSNYESDYSHPITRTGSTSVQLRVNGEGSKPLVLVFVSYEPVNWILSIPQGITIEKVLLGSYFIRDSKVTYSPGSVLSVERHIYQTLPYGYGDDRGGGDTDKLLEYVVGRFGPVASFSGSHKADSWTLDIHQGNTPDCPQNATSEAVTTIASPTEPVTSSGNDECTLADSVDNKCLGPFSYCPGEYYTGSTCIDGYCRCANNSQRDFCTCLAISGECRIEKDSVSAADTAAVIPRYRGRTQTTYSCVANENCNYDVHIISNHESNYNHGFGPVTRAGSTNVQLRVSGEGSKPLVLVFVSYEPVNWILSIPQGVIIERVLLGSYYLSNSDVTYSSGSVLNFERHNYQTLPCGYGSDTGGCETDKILEYVVSRFGPVASFSGSYYADSWTLNIYRGNAPGTIMQQSKWVKISGDFLSALC